MNFGLSFLNWIKTFYTNISRCVANNGYLSEFFLSKGVLDRVVLFQTCSLFWLWNHSPTK